MRTFPEENFLPPEEFWDGYLKTLGRGAVIAGDLRVVICGLIRQAGDHLATLKLRLQDMGVAVFKDYRICLYENDSTDLTPMRLCEWAMQNPKVHVRSEVLGRRKWPGLRDPRRTAQLAEYRNRVREMALSAADEINADAVIMLDTDVKGGYSLNGLRHTFGHWKDFDVMASNGVRWHPEHNRYFQYDSWCYRYENWNQRYYGEVKTYTPERGTPLVPLLSAFGGMAVYPTDVFRRVEYAGQGDVEHATFHRRLHEAGICRVFMNPSQLVLYS